MIHITKRYHSLGLSGIVLIEGSVYSRKHYGQLIHIWYIIRLIRIFSLALNIKAIVNVYNVILNIRSNCLIFTYYHVEYIILVFMFYNIRFLIIRTFQNIGFKCKASICCCSRLNFLAFLVYEMLHDDIIKIILLKSDCKCEIYNNLSVFCRFNGGPLKLILIISRVCRCFRNVPCSDYRINRRPGSIFCILFCNHIIFAGLRHSHVVLSRKGSVNCFVGDGHFILVRDSIRLVIRSILIQRVVYIHYILALVRCHDSFARLLDALKRVVLAVIL